MQEKIKKNELVQKTLNEEEKATLRKKIIQVGYFLVLEFVFNVFMLVVFHDIFFDSPFCFGIFGVLFLFFPYFLCINLVKKKVINVKINKKNMMLSIVQFTVPIVCLAVGLYFSIIKYKTVQRFLFYRNAHFVSLVFLAWFVFSSYVMVWKKQDKKYWLMGIRNVILWISVIAIFGSIQASNFVYEQFPTYQESIGILLAVAHGSLIGFLGSIGLTVGLYRIQFKLEHLQSC